MQRMFVTSLRGVANYIQSDPSLASVRAVGGATALLSLGEASGGVSLMRRLGFTIFPYPGPLGRFGEFWENFLTWWLMWAYNPASLRNHRLIRMRRTEIWIGIDEFIRRYRSLK
jgi:hypothetical protein